MAHEPHHHGHDAHDFDWAGMVGFIELEGEVFGSLTADAASVLTDACEQLELDVRRVVDLGCGPGVGTCLLAGTFRAATVVAVDSSPEMLEHVVPRAERMGFANRVRTQLVDLPDGLGELGPADLVWASMVLHHLGDEAGALGAIRALVEPGGLVAIVEFGEPTRVVPDDVDFGRPGLWARLDAAWAAWVADLRGGPSEDYPTMLARAGFDVVVDQMITADLEAPLEDRAREVARRQVGRMRERVEAYVDAGDLEALAALADEVEHRDDLFLHASRRLLIARPSGSR